MATLLDDTLANTTNWTNLSILLPDTNNSSPPNTSSTDNDTILFLSDSQVHPLHPPLANIVVSATLLCLLILVTIIGNVFVLAAILIERHLQTVSNYLVFSLAVADLAVAVLVMPMGAQYEVMSHEWVLGPILCEVWTSSDVLCCTASILHLVAIAVDRYCAVTSIDYVQHRNGQRVGLMIALVWGVGLLVSFAPMLGWKDDMFLYRIQEEKRCLVSQDMGYQIFATCATFYVPLIIILFLYWRIYQVARKRIRRRPGHAIRPTTLLPLVCQGNGIDMTSFNGSGRVVGGILASNVEDTPKPKRSALETKREKKAGKTLVIITGVFVVCWLPFFVTALLMALCPSRCDPGPSVFALFLWLGYANSTLNPLIYTIFSPDFRKAFARLLHRAFGRT